MVAVGIREFRNRASEFIRRARAGESVVLTDRGVPVAELRPVETQEPPEEIRDLVESGKITWRGGIKYLPTPVKMRPGDGGKTSTDYVREQRR
ncbi:MAG: type II toxin-antitoxin system prevent-host-death family antitoxin [Dehalococcoidia bacterium]|nr:type II toxin-antitoxin system prevent-host-death family antitoxin [Dehalococcoidia bacterium]